MRTPAVPPCCSVVVPAHDEAAVLGACLSSLAAGHVDGCQPQVVVVANGCRDDTAAVARSFPGTTVVELPAASKTAAINAGDAVATAWPRIYVDADVRLDPGALHHLAAALDADRAVVAAPAPSFDATASTWPVRAYYRVFRRLPYVRRHLTGLGVYGLSRAGRARFGAFPDLTADDLYVQRLFAPDERLVADGGFTVRTPRHLRALVDVRTRVARGNRELRSLDAVAGASTTGSTAAALARLAVTSPRSLADVLVYAAVTALARRRARRPARSRWERDDSSRSHPGPGREPVLLEGVAFSPLTEEEVSDRVVAEAAAGRGGRIVTPNVDIVRQLRRPANAGLLAGVDLVVADGMPLVWAGRLAGRRLPERVAGSSLTWSLCRRMAARGGSVFLLGAAPDVAREAGRKLQDAIPGLSVTGVLSPPLGFERSTDERRRIEEELRAAAPSLVLVALGFPKQEQLMEDLAPRFPGTWFLGCGGSLDLVAGRVVRAPRWVQAAGLEWAFRLSQEPRRLARRYLAHGVPFAAGMLVRAAASRRGGRA